jgi:magnesium chelatase family protein
MIQMERLEDSPRSCNNDLGPREISQYCPLDDECQSLIREAMEQLGLSARAYHRVLKLSRTIADLSGDEKIVQTHLAEALQYQPRE